MKKLTQIITLLLAVLLAAACFAPLAFAGNGAGAGTSDAANARNRCRAA